MEYLIVYMSHHGTTRSVVERMREHIGSERTTVVDLEHDHLPDLHDAQTILVGGSIHAGRIQKGITEFSNNNKALLLSKRLGLFLCYMNMEQGKEEFNRAFDEDLRNHAFAHGMFGGELLMDEMNFLEKLIMRAMGRGKNDVHALDDAAIAAFEQSAQESHIKPPPLPSASADGTSADGTIQG